MIKYILTTILIIYLVRLVAPFLFRWLLALFVKKSLRNGTFFYNGTNPPQQPPRSNGSTHAGRAKGNVNIDYIPEQPERRDFNGGEYVDYEEVK